MERVFVKTNEPHQSFRALAGGASRVFLHTLSYSSEIPSRAWRIRVPGSVIVPLVGAFAVAAGVGIVGSAIRPESAPPQFPTEEPSRSNTPSGGENHQDSQSPITIRGNRVIAKDIPSKSFIFDENKVGVDSISELDGQGNLTTSVELTGEAGTEAEITDNGNGTYTVVFK